MRELIAGEARAALAGGGRALDLACNEGWWSHRALEWGASFALGVEARAETVARAERLRAHFGLPADRLELRTGDATALDPEEVGTFELVLCLGLLYHLEDPVGTLRLARRLTAPGGLLVVETQTHRGGAVRHAWGSSDDAAETAEATFAVRWERDDAFPLASVDGVVSLIPNRAAVELSLHAAGFADVRAARPAAHHAAGFRSGDRLVVFAR